MIHLILGGARSGKSSFAENWCLEHQKQAGNIEHNALFYLATSTPSDAEMMSRIFRYKKYKILLMDQNKENQEKLKLEVFLSEVTHLLQSKL